MLLHIEYEKGPFPDPYLDDLREPHWEWKDGPASVIVAHDIRTRGQGSGYPNPIGIIRIFKRLISWQFDPRASTTLKAAAIGGVWVKKHYRKKRVGSQMLVEALRWIKVEDKYDVAILHSRSRQLYREAGFRPLGGGLWGLHLHDGFKTLQNADGTGDEAGDLRWVLEPGGKF